MTPQGGSGRRRHRSAAEGNPSRVDGRGARDPDKAAKGGDGFRRPTDRKLLASSPHAQRPRRARGTRKPTSPDNARDPLPPLERRCVRCRLSLLPKTPSKSPANRIVSLTGSLRSDSQALRTFDQRSQRPGEPRFRSSVIVARDFTGPRGRGSRRGVVLCERAGARRYRSRDRADVGVSEISRACPDCLRWASPHSGLAPLSGEPTTPQPRQIEPPVGALAKRRLAPQAQA